MQSWANNGNGVSGAGDEDSATAMGPEELAKSLTLEIDPPIDWNGKTYTTLYLEEPTAQMVERAESELAGNMSVHALRKHQIALVSQGAKVPRAVVEKMRISEVTKAADFLSSFIGSGRATGES